MSTSVPGMARHVQVVPVWRSRTRPSPRVRTRRSCAKQEPAKQQILAQNGVEEDEDEEQAVPSPGAAQELLAASDSTSVAKFRFSGASDRRDQLVRRPVTTIEGIRISGPWTRNVVAARPPRTAAGSITRWATDLSCGAQPTATESIAPARPGWRRMRSTCPPSRTRPRNACACLGRPRRQVRGAPRT